MGRQMHAIIESPYIFTSQSLISPSLFHEKILSLTTLQH